MRFALTCLAVLLAACADTSPNPSYADHVAMPTASADPYGGNGTVRAVAVVLSFDVEGQVYGDIGAHCGYDGWTPIPATARVHVGNATAPERVIMRMLAPGQDTEGVSHFGTATYVARADEITGAFDHNRVLGTVTWEPPRFAGHDIPGDKWLVVSFDYMARDDGVPVRETLALRDFGDVPVSLDRAPKMCF